MSSTTLGLVALVPAVAGLLALGARLLRSGVGGGEDLVGRPAGTGEALADPRLWALQRLVTDHLEARRPSAALATELRRLADRRLVLRQGVRIDAAPDRAVELLGADVVELLRTDEPRRLRLDQVDDVLRRIERL